MGLLARQAQRHNEAWACYKRERVAAQAARDTMAATAAQRLQQQHAQLYAAADAALQNLEDPRRLMELDEHGVEQARIHYLCADSCTDTRPPSCACNTTQVCTGQSLAGLGYCCCCARVCKRCH